MGCATYVRPYSKLTTSSRCWWQTVILTHFQYWTPCKIAVYHPTGLEKSIKSVKSIWSKLKFYQNSHFPFYNTTYLHDMYVKSSKWRATFETPCVQPCAKSTLNLRNLHLEHFLKEDVVMLCKLNVFNGSYKIRK